jgi:hypothetical protein
MLMLWSKLSNLLVTLAKRQFHELWVKLAKPICSYQLIHSFPNRWLAKSCWFSQSSFVFYTVHLRFSLTQHHKRPPPSRSQCKFIKVHNLELNVYNKHASAASLIAAPHCNKSQYSKYHMGKKKHDPPSMFGKQVSCITTCWKALASAQMLCLRAPVVHQANS